MHLVIDFYMECKIKVTLYIHPLPFLVEDGRMGMKGRFKF